MSKRGFTFIEVLIVLILIGVIAALGVPRLRNSLERSNIRSAKASLATLVATARAAAVQRGCTATLNLNSDSAWVTACNLTPPPTTVTVGTRRLVATEFNVTLSPSASAVTFDPRGIQTVFQTTRVVIGGKTTSDSVVINQVGKVVRQ